MKFLLLGLGNIGDEYKHTRHNIGFDILDTLIQDFDAKFTTDRLADICTIKLKGKQVLLVKPSTYMNLSGKALNYWMQKEKIAIENVLVLTDDLSLPLGKIRLRQKGSDGGHNGLKNIQEILGNENYNRLRFGIGNEFGKGQQVDFVLGKWKEEEKQILEETIKKSVDACKQFVLVGMAKTMNEYNK